MRRRFAARDDRGALVAPGLDVLHDALLLLARHERTHLRARIEARAEPDRLRRAADALDDAVEDLAVHVQARARCADLARVEKDRARGAADHGVDIGVRQHDDGRLAAELERHALHRVRGRLLISLPTSVEPVNAILSTPGCVTSAAPTVSP